MDENQKPQVEGQPQAEAPKKPGELAHKEIGEYLSVDAKLENGKLIAQASLDVSKLLDDAAIKLKAMVPGKVEEPFVDGIVAQLKEIILKK